MTDTNELRVAVEAAHAIACAAVFGEAVTLREEYVARFVAELRTALANPAHPEHSPEGPPGGWHCGNQHLHAERTMRLLEAMGEQGRGINKCTIQAICDLSYECGATYCEAALKMPRIGEEVPF